MGRPRCPNSVMEGSLLFFRCWWPWACADLRGDETFVTQGSVRSGVLTVTAPRGPSVCPRSWWAQDREAPDLSSNAWASDSALHTRPHHTHPCRGPKSHPRPLQTRCRGHLQGPGGTWPRHQLPLTHRRGNSDGSLCLPYCGVSVQLCTSQATPLGGHHRPRGRRWAAGLETTDRAVWCAKPPCPR